MLENIYRLIDLTNNSILKNCNIAYTCSHNVVNILNCNNNRPTQNLHYEILTLNWQQSIVCSVLNGNWYFPSASPLTCTLECTQYEIMQSYKFYDNIVIPICNNDTIKLNSNARNLVESVLVGSKNHKKKMIFFNKM